MNDHLILYLFAIILISCNSSKNDSELYAHKTDTIYYKNGQIHKIVNTNNGKLYGLYKEFDSINGKIIYQADFYNDTIDGWEYLNNIPEEYPTKNFYEMGKRKMMSKFGEVENKDSLWIISYYYFTSKFKALELGNLLFNYRNKVVDTLSDFFMLDYDKETVKLGNPMNLKFSIFSLNYYDIYKIRLYLINKKESKLLLDTVLRKTGNRTELELSITSNSCGKQKIRGLIELEDTSTIGERLVMKRWIFPVYFNFYVKN
ncbi:MAG: hypothetical protein GYA62_03190 [Bacteroidales bacterium]|nr:hypothetical protein [Bacteroidales bacterium]